MITLSSAVMSAIRTYKMSSDGIFTCSVLPDARDFFARNDSAETLQPFYEVARNGFSSSTMRPEEVKNHVSDDQLTILHRGNVLFGFASTLAIPEHDMVYLHGIVMLQEVQGKNMGRVMLEALLEGTPHSRFAFTTQNPCMFCLGRKITDSIFPNPETRIVPEPEQEIGAAIMRVRHKGEPFVRSTSIIQGLYEGYLYPTIPDSRDPRVNTWFGEALGIRDGKSEDGFLLIGTLKDTSKS